MTTIRNLSVSDILLNDIEGIVVQASSDYILNEEKWMGIASSIDLLNNINSGGIVFVGSTGNSLTKQESLDLQSGISITQPAAIVFDSGVTAAGGVHDVLNFVGSGTTITPSGNNTIDISLLPGLEFNTIGGERILTMTDPSRNNKKLSVEIGRYLFNHTFINSASAWMYIIDITTNPAAFSIPFNATLVGISSEKESSGSGDGVTIEYDLYVNNSLSVSTFATMTGGSPQKLYNDSLNVDVNANQTITVLGRRTIGSGGHEGISIVCFFRWRV